MDATTFLRHHVDTIPKIELLIFLVDNPSTMDTADSIARWAGIPLSTVEPILVEWEDIDLVKKDGEVYVVQPQSTLFTMACEVAQTYRTARHMVRNELEALQEERRRERHDYAHALRQEIGRRDTLLESMTDGVIILDRNRQVICFNRALIANLDISHHSPPPFPLEELTPDPTLRNTLNSICDRREDYHQLTWGSRCFDVSASSILDENGSIMVDDEGHPLGHLLVFHDVSAQVELIRMKEELSGLITHDLRSPMTGIFTAFEMLLKDGRSTVPSHLLKACELGRRTSQFILGLVNDLLDIHRLEGNSIPIERNRIDITAMINESIDQITPMAREKNLSIVQNLSESPVYLLGDTQKLVRVMVNLLSNATKFTQKQGTITITVTTEYQRNSVNKGSIPDARTQWIQITIQDNGYGIPPESLPHVFEKYYRVQFGKTHTIAGTGLGLYFCRLIIEAHGGTIDVESTLNHGSTFIVKLPSASR